MPASRKKTVAGPAAILNRPAIDRIVAAVLHAWRAPGAAVAIVCGDETYVQGYGFRHIGRDEPVTPLTLFAIGSLTKAFTTTAMALLVEEGKMRWDDHPREYIPFFTLADPVADANVTLRDLVCHRTGMPRHDILWFVREWDRAEVIRRYGKAPAKHPFRTAYEYANIPYIAAGLAIGAASGEGSWEAFVQSRLLTPLGMTRANYSVDAAQQDSDHASPHVRYHGKVTAIPWRNLDRERPAGGINAGAGEMSAWLRFLLDGGETDGTRLIAAEHLHATQAPHVVVPLENPDARGFDTGVNLCTYCLGWEKLEYRGQVLVGHGGAIDGFTSSITLLPQRHLGMVVLLNTSEWPVITVLTNSLRDLLLGLPHRNWTADYRALQRAHQAEVRHDREQQQLQPRTRRSRPTRELEAYAGEYTHSAFGTLTVARDGDWLAIRYGMLAARLAHLHFDTFQARFDLPGLTGELKAHFILDVDGSIASVRTYAPWIEAEFTRNSV